MFNTKKLHLGLAFDHLNRPATGFGRLNNYNQLPVSFIGQLGYTFQKNSNPDFSITPSLIYISNSKGSFWQANLAFRYKWATAGIGYADDHTSVMLGYYSKSLIIGYSFGSKVLHAVNPYPNYYAHEISLRYFFKGKKEGNNKNGE